MKKLLYLAELGLLAIPVFLAVIIFSALSFIFDIWEKFFGKSR